MNKAAGCISCVLILAISNLAYGEPSDPLPSWKDGDSKQNILNFVAAVTKSGSPDFINPAERIAIFDNDGTLWTEQPVYVQLAFALDRIKAMAPQHPKWKGMQPFQAVLENDMETLKGGGEVYLLDIVRLSHQGMTTDEFRDIVTEWLRQTQHPRFNRLYSELVYKPMRELLDYLRANGFKTYIVTGGGIEFVRVFSEEIYGIPPEQVIGSSVVTKWDYRGDQWVLVRTPNIDSIVDNKQKPVAINQFIGRRPVVAFGNSDGDLQMLQWTGARQGKSLVAIIHHTDNKREWQYDRNSKIGHLDKALADAKTNNWLVVDMKKDWKTVYAFEQ